MGVEMTELSKEDLTAEDLMFLYDNGKTNYETVYEIIKCIKVEENRQRRIKFIEGRIPSFLHGIKKESKIHQELFKSYTRLLKELNQLSEVDKK